MNKADQKDLDYFYSKIEKKYKKKIRESDFHKLKHDRLVKQYFLFKEQIERQYSK